MQAPFFLRDFPSEAVLELLDQTVLGTNLPTAGTGGAKYKHLDTAEIISQLDNPLFLSIERNSKALSNITFCRRNNNWYIRYFAFAQHLQAQQKGREGKQSNGLLKKETERFFEEKLQEEVSCFYGYVDPNNEKSKWMCENFGFKQIGTLATQTFSRRTPKKATGFEILSADRRGIHKFKEIEKSLAHFKNHLFYTDYQAKRVKFAAIKDYKGNAIAFAKYQSAHWRIDALPGKSGKYLVNLIPYIPFVSSVFKPKNHRFIVAEAVVVKNNDPELLTQLFESILAHENYKLMLWWIDEREMLWQNCKTKIRWGLFHRLLKNPLVNVYARYQKTDLKEQAKTRLIYVSGMDLI